VLRLSPFSLDQRMRQRSSFALGLAWTAALALASPYALGATPRQKKPARASAGKKSKKVEVEEAPAPPPVEEKPAPPAEPTPPPVEEAKPETKPEPLAAEKPAAHVDSSLATKAETEALSENEAALGRREARRIAAGRVLVGVWAGGGIANRRFTYRDAVGYNLADYRLPVAPMASFGIEAYPAASSDVPVLRDLGIVAHVSRGFAFDSTTPQGATIETSWTRFGGELRERLIVPGPHRLEVGVLVGVDASYFGMTASRAVPALLPAARTVALRMGFDARLKLGWRLSVLAGGAYLLTTSRGEIYDHFHDASVHGVDGDFGFGVDLGSGLEARLAGRYTRYFASFKPVLGDKYVAGGALDEQLQAGLGVYYAH
jgi:hypothetical protein